MDSALAAAGVGDGVKSSSNQNTLPTPTVLSTTAPTPVDPGAKFTAVVPKPVPAVAPLCTLLYVEDNPANLALVEQLMARRSDIRLLTAVNGTLGIELARVARPDMILMDINLPGLSGIEALKILREDPATAHIPIVALSANAMPRDIKKGLEAGFFYYLTKPIKLDEFMDTIDVALEFTRTLVGANKTL